MKQISNYINEAMKAEYLVAFNDFTDNVDIPITCTVSVPKSVSKDFEKFLLKEEGNIFAHADGGDVEY